MGIEYTRHEQQILDEAERKYNERKKKIEREKGKLTREDYFNLDQDRLAETLAILSDAWERHFRGLAGDPRKIYQDAREQALRLSEGSLSEYLRAWEQDETPAADRKADTEPVFKGIKLGLIRHYQALDGEQDIEGRLLTERLDEYIKECIENTIRQEKEVAVTLKQAIDNMSQALPLESIKIVRDAVNRQLFNNKIIKQDTAIRIGYDFDGSQEIAVFVSASGALLSLDDKLVFEAICELYNRGNRFITCQDIHNTTSGGRYTKMSPTRATEIYIQVEKLAGKRIRIDLTEAMGKYKGIDTIPIEELTDTNDKTRKIAKGVNVLYAAYSSESDGTTALAGWNILEEPLTFVFASAIHQVSIMKTEALRLPFKRRPDITNALISYLFDRIEQANSPNVKQNSRVILCTTLYKAVGVSKGNKKQKMACRSAATTILEHWQCLGEIEGFKWRKTGNAITHLELNMPTDNKQLSLIGHQIMTE